ncbi:MAG TPA: PAS domain-containing protein, partial [Methylomirabilota bacterium]|nr:PAS domain-containing protein [Methylomirabilota bacterium]
MIFDELRETLSGKVDDLTFAHMMEGLFSVPHVALWVKDLELRYIYVTPAWERSANLSQEVVIGRRDEDFRAADVAERFRTVDLRILATGRAETREERHETPTGMRAFASTKFPLRDRTGRIIAIAGISTETTDFRTLPPVHRTDEALLAVVLESMPEAIVRFTPDFRVTFANPSFVAMYARDAPVLVGADLAELFAPATVALFRAAAEGLTATAPQAVLERQTHRYDGRPRWRQWRLGAAFDADGAMTEIQAIGSDVTDQKLYQQALEGLLSSSRQVDAPLDQIMDEVLAIGIQYFDLDYGAIWRDDLEGGRVERIVSRPGIAPPEAEGVADIVRSLPPLGSDPVAVENGRATGDGADLRLGAYVRQQLEVSGETYGSVMFFSPSAKATPFPSQGPMLQRLIGQWLAVAIERNRRLGELSRSQTTLSLILESVPAQVLTIDAAGAVITANAAARAAQRPDDSRDVDAGVLIEGRPRSNRLERWEDAEGEIRWKLTDRIPFVDAATGEPRLLVVVNDVTEGVEK